VEIRSKGNTYRIVLSDAEISINGLLIKPFVTLTALHGMLKPTFAFRFANFDSRIYGAIFPYHASFVSYSWSCLASLGPFWLSRERDQKQKVAAGPANHFRDHCFGGYHPRHSRDG
jgi:hypothetical protein